jgi:hypothetical protein
MTLAGAKTATMHESTKISYSSDSSLEARRELFELFKSHPGTEEELERSLGLFIRGSLLARFMAIGEVYRQILSRPGIVVDLGTWRGQTAVLCENFRAIFEPLHLNRRIVCFDTFEGYRGFSDEDRPSTLHRDGTYDTGGSDYARRLAHLLEVHERNNAMGHQYGKHRVIHGDCRETLPQFFAEHRNEFVALAFFDLNSSEPTRAAFDLIWDRLVPGGVVAIWQLTRDAIPAEGMVYTDHILNKRSHSVERSPVYPGLCYLRKH